MSREPRHTWILTKADDSSVAKDKDGHLLYVDVHLDVFGELCDGPSCCHSLVQVLAEALAALLGLETSTQTSRAVAELYRGDGEVSSARKEWYSALGDSQSASRPPPAP